ncbi:diaminopimelate decarboxylase [Kitasatospora sp. MAP12-15]|uniref:type III PLP-dependent enzyme n=1 Tax=unclassified Kitasatospora TaxID=2633591 RepID=UPI002472EAAA|nr:type III PLP-dependent enzyme [Kitasatospora sp. MAP12-44]MDH6113891.1 diaminopimelate decarboxylase [Kitasatospora sp. MAP12-44]
MSAPADTLATALPVALEALAGVPTPAYVYDLAEVRRNHDRLRAALPERAGLYYSLKANPHPALLATLRECGAHPEVCSTGELDAALAAGWPAGDVLYSGPGKRDAEVADALERGVRLFSVDSPHAIEQLDRLAAARALAAECLLRVNDDQPVPGQGLAMTGVPSQFGADTGWVLAEPARFTGGAHAKVVGLHLYMGSNLSEVGALLGQFRQALDTARRLAAVLAEHGVRLRLLDLGGGFGAPFAKSGAAVDLSELRGPLTELLAELGSWSARPPDVSFESGRYLVGTAGTLLTAVLDVKRSHGRTIAVLESGINHLGGNPGLRRLPPLSPHVLSQHSEGQSSEGESSTSTMVTGPLCTPLDTWARDAKLPALRPGDLVAVPNVGAYGLYASLVAFLGHPLPVEAVVDSDRPDRAPEISRLTLTRTSEPTQE